MIDALPSRSVLPVVLGLLTTLASMLGLGGCASGSTDADIQTMKIQQFQALVEESRAKPGQILIIDSRTADEFRAQHVEGARNIRAEQVRPESPIFAELSTYETIVVYGADPRAGGAKSVCKRLMDNEATDSAKIYWFQGGMQFWRAAGYPVVETAPAPGQTPAAAGGTTPPNPPGTVNISPRDNAPPPEQPMPLPPPPR